MMFPVLYGQNEMNFEHLGLGVLRDVLSCVVIEERNGAFELRMTLPLDGMLVDVIKPDMIVKADASYEKIGQLFRIKRITKTKDNEIAIVAHHVSYLTKDLSMNPTLNFSGNGSQVLRQWLDNVVGDDHQFTVLSNIMVVRQLSLNLGEFDNARDVLGKILETWGGDYYINNYQIELLERRDIEANTLISYGRNLTDLKQEENIANTFTSIQPYAIIREANDDGDTIQRIITSTPAIIDSEHVDKFPNRRILPVDFSREFERDEVPTAERLVELANEYIEIHQIGVPQVSIKVSFVDLSKALNFDGLPSEQLELGDTVPVYFEKLGIRSRAPINRVEWNVLTGAYEQIELGEVKANLADRVRDVENGMNTALNRPPVIDGSNIANIPPGPITNFKAVGGFSQIHLFWDFQGIHIDYYEIERSLTQGSGFVRLTRSRVSSYSDIVEVNQQFFYRVRAVNFHGISGEWSEVDGAQTANALPIDEHENRLDRVREIVADWCYDYPDKVTIDGGRIEANTITAREIVTGSITGLEIAGDTIDASHIRAGAITTEHMQAGTISGDVIATGSLSADTIRGGSMTADFIKGGVINSSIFETYNNGQRLLRIDNQGLHMSAVNAGHGALRWTNAAGQFNNVTLQASGQINLQPAGQSIEFRTNREMHGALLNAADINRGIINRDRIPGLHANWITEGVLNAARIPAINASTLTNATPASANNSGRAVVGNLLIQWGQVNTVSLGIGSSTTNRINFPVGSQFNHTPNVQVIAHNTNFTCAINGIGWDHVTIGTRHTVNVNAGVVTVRWVAIGRLW